MSKYGSLWEYVKGRDCPRIKLSFGEIGRITGVGLDHSFLKYKKELTRYGYQVEKISLKEETVVFKKID